MKNFERYKTIDEQIIAHERYCKKHAKYGDCKNCIECALRWIFLEAEEELKPCPFCGGEAKTYCVGTEVEYTGSFTDSVTHHLVICTKCDANTGNYDTEEKAIERWNRRADNG